VPQTRVSRPEVLSRILPAARTLKRTRFDFDRPYSSRLIASRAGSCTGRPRGGLRLQYSERSFIAWNKSLDCGRIASSRIGL